ncbi:P-loop containing nucleoside triphosphate hydrolase protein [Mycena latifolia]|nr:P-loop containing nucleoside triphosphate hydrolase protein [Mycena latifolia]
MRLKSSRRAPQPSLVPSAANQVPREYKIVLVGEDGVGKTALATQFAQERFEEVYDPTIEDVYRKQCVIDDETVLLDVYEIVSREEGPSPKTARGSIIIITDCVNRPPPSQLRPGEGFLLVYSITSRDSFNRLRVYHNIILNAKDRVPFRMILLANKCDLEHERQVSMDEGRDLAKDLACNFIETSAKQRTNVDEAFYNLVREIRRFNKGCIASQESEQTPAMAGGGGDGPSDSQNLHDESGAAGCCACIVL